MQSAVVMAVVANNYRRSRSDSDPLRYLRPPAAHHLHQQQQQDLCYDQEPPHGEMVSASFRLASAVRPPTATQPPADALFVCREQGRCCCAPRRHHVLCGLVHVRSMLLSWSALELTLTLTMVWLTFRLLESKGAAEVPLLFGRREADVAAFAWAVAHAACVLNSAVGVAASRASVAFVLPRAATSAVAAVLLFAALLHQALIGSASRSRPATFALTLVLFGQLYSLYLMALYGLYCAELVHKLSSVSPPAALDAGTTPPTPLSAGSLQAPPSRAGPPSYHSMLEAATPAYSPPGSVMEEFCPPPPPPRYSIHN